MSRVLEHRRRARSERAHRVDQREIEKPKRKLQARRHLLGLVAIDQQPIEVTCLQARIFQRQGDRLAREI